MQGCTGRVMLGALLALAALSVQAQVDTTMAAEEIGAPDKSGDKGPWSAKVAGGYAKTSGNSDSSAANFSGEGRYDKARWHHILGLTAVINSSAADRDSPSETTAESYWAGLKSQYDFAPAWYGFGSLDWYKDRFSAYDHQLYEAAGLGWRALRSEAHKLDLEFGAGAKQAKLVSGDKQNEAIGLLRGLYVWKISENASFEQKLAVLSGSDNTYTESVSQLKAGIIGNLSMVLGYTWKHNTDVEIDNSLVPPRAFDKTDTFTTVSLEYVF